MLGWDRINKMNTTKFIEQSINESYERLVKSLSDLNPDELIWRSAPHANCIAEILWHTVRIEDRMIARIESSQELWEKQKWYDSFGYPLDLPMNTDYQILTTLKLPPPGLADLLSYMSALHQNTMEKLSNLSSEDLDRSPNPSNPERTIALLFRHLIVHTNNHHGQIDYIRGLMQKDWDLPPGTGIVQQ